MEKCFAESVMIAPQHENLSQQLINQCLDIRLACQGKISQMKHDIIRLNLAVPVLDNLGLPVIGTIAVTTDIPVKEVGIGDDPSLRSDGKGCRSILGVMGFHDNTRSK
jgi:hypothetical protein